MKKGLGYVYGFLVIVGVTVLFSGCNQDGTARGTPTPIRGETPKPTQMSEPGAMSQPTKTPAPTATPSPVPQGDLGCRRGDPLANVYLPERLQVITPCITVTGIVQAVRQESDGDLYINLKLDPTYAHLVNDKNVTKQHGELVVEVVPADQPGCTPGKPPKPRSGNYDYGICTGANIRPPVIGQHVSVTGPYVLDTKYGWMEIHPAWVIAPASP